ncbi:MAG: hypothetical protein HS102_07875 [Planctomycetia bacterium]|nr:hypothetical protein [Planctomycetia bacterium]MBE7456532.1 hypothetical protein [Planctomycetia bacterium]
MVSSRHLRLLSRLLTGAAVACLAAAPYVFWRLSRVPPLTVDASVPTDASTGEPASIPEHHDLTWYAPLWERDLKQPPLPPTEEAKPVPTPARPAPSVLATFVQSEESYAHLVGRAGEAELLAVDDSLDGYRLVAIEPGRVQLELGGERFWVEMPQPKGVEP